MRVAYVDPHPVPGSGIEALQIAQNVDAFARTGAAVDLVSPQPSGHSAIDELLGREWADGVERSYVPDYRTRWWAPSHSNRMFFRAARRRLARAQPDAIWVRHLRCADAMLRMPGAPAVFFEAHEVFARTLAEQAGVRARKVARLRALEHSVYQRVRGVIVLTSALAADLRDDYACTAPMLVAPDGYDAILAERATAAATGAGPVILYIGSLHAWKGVDVAVRAMRAVTRGTLVVVGGNERSIGPLRALAATTGVADRVRFEGAVAPRRRFDWIASATVCVLPLSRARIATHYTSPLKLFEYLALAKPVVTADVPSMREIVEHRKSAWLVDGADPARFAEAINALVGDDALRTSIAAGARRVATAHTWDARARAIHDFVAAQLGAGAR